MSTPGLSSALAAFIPAAIVRQLVELAQRPGSLCWTDTKRARKSREASEPESVLAMLARTPVRARCPFCNS